MAEQKTVSEGVTLEEHAIHHPSTASDLANPGPWVNWRLTMNRKMPSTVLDPDAGSRARGCRESADDCATIVIIIGLALSLWGYDNNFVSPLVSLPYFIERYQGGTNPAFTVGNFIYPHTGNEN